MFGMKLVWGGEGLVMERGGGAKRERKKKEMGGSIPVIFYFNQIHSLLKYSYYSISTSTLSE